MKKKFLLFFILLMITGCKNNYTRSDIDSYIKDNIGIDSYNLSDVAREIKNEEDTDKYWHVAYKDIEFDVIDDEYLASGVKENKLTNNYFEKVFDYYIEKYDKDIKFRFEEVYEKREFTCSAANYEKEINYEKLEECYNSVYDFLDNIDKSKYPIKEDIEIYVRNSTTVADMFYIYENGKLKNYNELKLK